ncbi:hypothetical protein ACVHNB_18930 [Streptomyces sp. YJ-C3]
MSVIRLVLQRTFRRRPIPAGKVPVSIGTSAANASYAGSITVK